MSTPEEAREILDWQERYNSCPHSNYKSVRKTIAIGSHQARKQCLDCGKAFGSSRKQDAETDQWPLFDDNLLETKESEKESVIKRIKAKHQKLRDDKDDSWWRRYNDHLSSEKWKTIRLAVLKRASGICEGCGTKVASEAHHLTYKNMGAEFLFELVAVCADCHEKLHLKRELDTEDLICAGCRYQSTSESQEPHCGKFDLPALKALAPSGSCGPNRLEFEPLR